MITEQILVQLMTERMDGEVTSREFLDKLMENGIFEYEISVEHAMATYIGESYRLQLDSPYEFEVNEEFNKDLVYESIQKKDLPIKEFLTEIAKAGVAKYNLYIPENVTVYYGMNGEVIEELTTH